MKRVLAMTVVAAVVGGLSGCAVVPVPVYGGPGVYVAPAPRVVVPFYGPPRIGYYGYYGYGHRGHRGYY